MIQHRDWGKYDMAGAMSRDRISRWNARARAIVVHPERGAVIVPAGGGFAALKCAAEVWGCDWMEIRGATVRLAKENAPVGPVQEGDINDHQW